MNYQTIAFFGGILAMLLAAFGLRREIAISLEFLRLRHDATMAPIVSSVGFAVGMFMTLSCITLLVLSFWSARTELVCGNGHGRVLLAFLFSLAAIEVGRRKDFRSSWTLRSLFVVFSTVTATFLVFESNIKEHLNSVVITLAGIAFVGWALMKILPAVIPPEKRTSF